VSRPQPSSAATSATFRRLGRNVDAGYLWPETQDEKLTQVASTAEFVAFYPNRGAVPAPLWADLVSEARQEVSLLVYAGLFWFDALGSSAGRLLRAENCRNGCMCRVRQVVVKVYGVATTRPQGQSRAPRPSTEQQ